MSTNSRYNEIRNKVKQKSNKISFLQLKSLALEEKELSEQLEEHKKAIKVVNKKRKELENELRDDKKLVNSLSESLTALEVEYQKHKEELSAQTKRRATLKVMAPDSLLIVRALNLTSSRQKNRS